MVNCQIFLSPNAVFSNLIGSAAILMLCLSAITISLYSGNGYSIISNKVCRFDWTLFCLFVFYICLGSFVFADTEDNAPAGKRVIAVLDDISIKNSHSNYFKSIQERGFHIDFFSADDKNLVFKKYGEWKYDHLILFAPSASEISGIKSRDVLDFIDDGHNVIIAASSNIGDMIREVGSECNVEFDEEDSYVIDHFNFDTSDYVGAHSLIVSDNFADAPVIFKTIEAPILFRGVGQDIEEDSALIGPLVSGYLTSYSHSLTEPVKELHVAGKKTALVSALQARNNARVIFSGSLDLFSDKFFNSPVQKYTTDGKSTKYPRSGNENFCKQITQWAFQEKGVIRLRDANTHKVGETVQPYSYTIKDNVTYSVTIEEWNGRRWVPYVADDVQLEYRMIDPYIRTTLKPDSQGQYIVTFILPDVYGVFTFKVEYKHRGYSFLTSIIRVPVRPFKHNEYERFIDSAYPYYASAFSMMGGLFLFSWVFLYHKE